MKDDFHDRLATLCAAEVTRARREATGARFADMILALGTLLGRTIGVAAQGQSAGIDALLTASDQLVAQEAAGMAGLMALAQVQARAPGKAVRS